MLLVMGKLVLAADQNGRLMRGVIVQSMKLATESWPIVAVKKGVQGYLNAQGTLKDKGNSQDVIQKHLGPPAVHGFNGLVQHFIAMEIKEPDKKKNMITAQLKIKEAVEMWKQTEIGWEGISAHINHCKVSKMYHSGDKRLEVIAMK
eukprot:2894089-Karenia_brevis.AAC.1